MPTVLVPYHLDEHLPDLRVSLPDGTEPIVVAPELGEGDVWSRLADVAVPTAEAVAAVAHERPVIVSGDCSTSLAVMTGLQRAGLDPAIVWFDAHGDVQTVETSHSGYPGGMPLRIILGYRPDLIADRLGLRPITEERALLVGARDLDPPEAEYLATAAVGRSEVADTASKLPPGPLVLHIDLDVIDSAEVPSLRYPVGCGPAAADVIAAARAVLATGQVVAVDIACTWFNGTDEAHARLLTELLAET
ncbi:arginase family protein [Phytomonospora sp. NPDC050363]|uniref:arginase family protein n=1 Tax=Phytomonospora sp. NPDC050363 TaxID=3155642 RepID=UPI0033D9DA46